MSGPSRALKLVHPRRAPTPQAAVSVAFGLKGTELVARFEVSGFADRHVNAGLSAEGSQWGLWDWDVVELFLCTRQERPCYYEFQLSPLGQYCELRIHEPRKRFDRDFSSGFKHSVTTKGEGAWSADFRLPLAALDWDGKPESLVGNAFAILGKPEARTYWSLTLPYQEQPDFHLPEHFRPLLA